MKGHTIRKVENHQNKKVESGQWWWGHSLMSPHTHFMFIFLSSACREEGHKNKAGCYLFSILISEINFPFDKIATV